MKKLIVTFVVLALMIAGALFGYFMGLDRPSSPAVSPKKELAAVKAVPPAAPAPQPQPAPETGKRKLLGNEFRGIYITSWTAGIKRFYELTDMMASSYLNGVVIDIKDSTGKVGFPSKLPMVAETGAYERRILHLDAILKHCKERNIHTVARIAVFQDPNLAKAKPSLAVGTAGGKVWKDRKGLSWVDPASEAVWKYNVDLAKEVAALGFDEVQFDYVRFPTDGKLKTVTYPVFKHDVPKHEIIKRFFQYVDRELKPVNVLTSADVFGLTVMAEDDLNIGQRLEDVADYVDYVCPMIYPSHFPPGHLGLKNPGMHPYRIIYDSSMRGLKRLEGKRAKMRPWLQDFKLGGPYDKPMILDQVQASRDAGVFGFTMWNARNVYTANAYKIKLPEPNPNPPLKAQLMAEFNRQVLRKGGAEISAPHPAPQNVTAAGAAKKGR